MCFIAFLHELSAAVQKSAIKKVLAHIERCLLGLTARKCPTLSRFCSSYTALVIFLTQIFCLSDTYFAKYMCFLRGWGKSIYSKYVILQKGKYEMRPNAISQTELKFQQNW